MKWSRMTPIMRQWTLTQSWSHQLSLLSEKFFEVSHGPTVPCIWCRA